MSQLAVLTACHTPFRSGFPSAVREARYLRSWPAEGAAVSASRAPISALAAPATTRVDALPIRLFDMLALLWIDAAPAAVMADIDARNRATGGDSMRRTRWRAIKPVVVRRDRGAS